jgi:hypothetical protein
VRIPPEPILLAAKRWLEILPSSGGVPRAQALLTTHASYSDLTPTQYASALAWVREIGLLEEAGEGVPAGLRVLSAIFEKAAPAWFPDADDLVRTPEELPSDIVSAGEAIGLDQDVVYAQLLSSWGKVDTAERERIGAAGEQALVDLLAECPSGRVDHVSMRSDGFGFDIAFALGCSTVHLEVKSTTRQGRFTAYLSRNEHSVMLRDDRWVLVAVRLTPDLEIDAVGSVPREFIADNLPREVTPFGSWASVKLEVPAGTIVGGIPQLSGMPKGLLPYW